MLEGTRLHFHFLKGNENCCVAGALPGEQVSPGALH